MPKGTAKNDLSAGWRYERRREKYNVWYDDKGRRYKSSTEVQAELRKQGLLLESETDTAEESLSQYEPSPVKKPRNELQPSTSTYV